MHRLRKMGATGALALATLFMIAPLEAHAFDLFGIHLWGKRKDGSENLIGTPKYYSVNVYASPGSDEAGVKIVNTSSALVADYKKPVSGSAGLLIKARSDYRRILAALYAQGRYGANISIKVNGREAAEIPADSELPDQSTVLITIDCGPLYRFSKANISSLPASGLGAKDSRQILADAGYEAGKLAKSTTIMTAGQTAVTQWRNHGYAKAGIAGQSVIADHALRTINADIAVAPGRLAYYGPLTIKNVSKNPRMDSSYVAWMTGLKQGQRYNPVDVTNANKRLAALDVFRASVLHEGDHIGPDGSLPMSLVLQERPPRRFGFGGSYSTLDGAGMEAYWMHRNLFGHAEKLRFDAKISGVGGNQDNSYNPQNFSYLLGTTFTRQGIFTPNTDFTSSLNGEREVLDNYTTTTAKAQAGFTHKINNVLVGRLFAHLAQIEAKDDYFGRRNFTTFGLLGGLLYDSRDDVSNAHRGIYAESVIEPFYEKHYGHFINKVTIEGRSYLTLDRHDRFTLASRIKLGSISGAPISEIPSNVLFFAGGGGSVRGYGYRNIGLKTKTNDTIGGRSLVEGSAEMRTMFTDAIGLVAFVDAGIVGENAYPDFSQAAKIGAGIGARYLTSLGPLRLDLAVPLNRMSGDPDLGFYIGIGQAF